MTVFKKATKLQSKLRLALIGVSGSGKTYSALSIAKGLGGKVALIDTERGSAAKYADVFDFDAINLDEVFGDFSPRSYVKAIQAAVAEGYNNIIIDSLSHAWVGKGGALEMHDQAVDRQKTKNSYVAWRDVTPEHNALVDALVQAKANIIVTMRAKTEYVQDTDERGNKQVRKIGLAPVQRDGLEYEFDIVADMDAGKMTVTKSRCPALTNAVIKHPNGQVSDALKAWLTDGAPARELTPEEKAAAELEKRKSGLLAWYDAGNRINTSNAANTDKSVKEIADAIGYTFQLEDGHNNPAGRLAALVEHLKAQQPATEAGEVTA